MANVTYVPAAFYSALVADQTIVYNGMNMFNLISTIGNMTLRPISSGVVGDSCISEKTLDQVTGQQNINTDFFAWFYGAKYSLDNLGSIGSYYYQILATIFVGIYGLKASALPNIANHSGSKPTGLVGFRFSPNFGSAIGSPGVTGAAPIFNGSIAATTSYTWKFVFPTEFSTKTFTLKIINFANGTAFASQSGTVGSDGIASVAFTTGAGPVTGDDFYASFTGFSFLLASDYVSSLKTDIGTDYFANFGSNIISAFAGA